MKAKTILILLIFMIVLPLYHATAEDRFSENSITIKTINTTIDRKTRRDALLRELQIQEGREYPSYEYLERLLSTRVYDIEDRRLFHEFDVKLSRDENGDAIVDIVVIDSFTLIPRPIVKYTTTIGLMLGLKVEYFNAFGTMTDHELEAYWSPSELFAGYQIEKIVVGPFHLGVQFEQLNKTIRYGSPTGEIVASYQETSSLVSAEFTMPLGPFSRIRPWNPLKYVIEPVISWYYNYRPDFNNTSYSSDVFNNEGFTPGFNHGFFSDRSSWVGNFRKGFDFEFINYNLWYTGSGNVDVFLETELRGYWPATEWLELSGRISGFYAPLGIRKEAGDRLRGVIDYQTYGEYGGFLNAQAHFKVLDIDRFAEIQMGPFVDIGYVISDDWGDGPDAAEYCVGGDIIIFFDALPAMALNINWGWDFKRNTSELIIDTVNFF